MKTLSLFIIFLTVNFFITGMAWGAESLDSSIKKASKEKESTCIRICRNFSRESCKTDYSKYKNEEECKKELYEECTDSAECKKTDSRSDCNSLAKEIDDASDKAAEECDRMEKTETTGACLAKAQQCNDGMSTDPENLTGFMNSAMGLMSTIKGLPNGNQMMQQSVQIPEGCTIEDDDKEASSNEKIQEKIQRLKEEIADLQKDQKEADKDLADKKDKVTEDIQKLQEEIDKNKTDRKTEDQKKAADIAKQTLAAQKTQTKALLDIDAKNREINQVKLSAQGKVLQYSDTNLLLACRSQIEEKKAKLIASNKGKGNKGTASIKNELQAFADTCIQAAKVTRKQELQTLQDRISQLNSDIAEKNNDIQGSKKTVQQEQSNLQALKDISDKAETDELQMQQSKTNRLNQSVLDMEKYVKEKQNTIQQKIDSKNSSIQELILTKLKKKPKYKKVISAAQKQSRALSRYNVQCCIGDSQKSELCSEVETSKSRSSGKGRKAK